jgi:hypothetical protein
MSQIGWPELGMCVVCLLQGKSCPVLPALYDARRALCKGRFLTSIFLNEVNMNYTVAKVFSDHSSIKNALWIVSC